MSGENNVVFNHVGVCVSDLARARRFYEQALGFDYWWELKAPDDGTSTLLRVRKPVDLHAVYLRHGDVVLELLHFGGPDHPQRRERVMNEPGLTHLSLSVEDIAATLERVGACGGEVLEDTDVGAAVMVRDPDGQLLELTSWQWRSALPPLP
jgi:catechol 2,3-dioxygenase-like lactoylglutathione lyase family enzyme